MGGGTIAVIVVVVVLVVAAAVLVPVLRRREHQRAEHPDIGLPDLGELAPEDDAQPKGHTREDEEPR